MAIRVRRLDGFLLLCLVLDFFGRAVLAKLFFCDSLLSLVAATELTEPTPQQRVMRQEMASLDRLDEQLGGGGGGLPRPAVASGFFLDEQLHAAA